MKVSVKTLKGNQFDIEVQPSDVVINVKKQIEQFQGAQSYPCERQLLIYEGQVLQDENTMEEIKVTENSFFVVMLSQKSSTEQAPAPSPSPSPSQKAIDVDQLPFSSPPATVGSSDSGIQDAASVFERQIRELAEMRGDRFDEHTIACALRAGFNYPSRVINYLVMCSGLEDPPEELVVPPEPFVASPASVPFTGQAVSSPAAAASTAPQYQTAPNASPLFLFPQDLMANMETEAEAALDIETDEDIYPLTWQETYRLTLRGVSHNTRLRRIVRQFDADVLSDSDIEDADADAIPEEEREAIRNVEMEEGDEREALISTQEERQAIRRIQNMGFQRRHVIEAFLAFDRNEEYAAQYLLDHPYANDDADLLHNAYHLHHD